MPCNYSKIDASGVAQNEDTLEQQQNHAERGRLTMWAKTMDSLRRLRWAVAFVLLFAILVCEISILREQRTSLPIGGEVNGLVPHCEFLAS
jgi:hypothetical protein